MSVRKEIMTNIKGELQYIDQNKYQIKDETPIY